MFFDHFHGCWLQHFPGQHCFCWSSLWRGKGFWKEMGKKKRERVRIFVAFNENQIFQSHPCTPDPPASLISAELLVSFAWMTKDGSCATHPFSPANSLSSNNPEQFVSDVCSNTEKSAPQISADTLSCLGIGLFCSVSHQCCFLFQLLDTCGFFKTSHVHSGMLFQHQRFSWQLPSPEPSSPNPFSSTGLWWRGVNWCMDVEGGRWWHRGAPSCCWKTLHCLEPSPSSQGLIPLVSRNHAILTDGLRCKQPRKHVYS